MVRAIVADTNGNHGLRKTAVLAAGENAMLQGIQVDIDGSHRMRSQLVLGLRRQGAEDFVTLNDLESLKDQGVAAAEIADHITSRTAGGKRDRP